MKVNIVTGTEDKWILWDMAEYIKKYNSDIEIEISAKPIEGYDVYHIQNDEMYDYPNINWHKAVYTCHQFEKNNYRRTFWARKLALEKARCIGCVNMSYLNMLKENGIKEDKLYYTPAGVDMKKFELNEEIHEKYTIGYVGRKYKSGRKGEDLFRDIVSKLDSVKNKIKFIFLGDKRGEEVKFCRQMGIETEYYKRGENLEYEDYPNIYKKMDCLLVTSKEEGGPVPVLEALACGLDVITTPVGITKDLFKNTSIGFFYNDALTAATQIYSNVLENEENRDNEEWINAYLAHRESVRSVLYSLPYTWERWANIYREIYERIYNETKDKIMIEDYMEPDRMNSIQQKYSQMAKDQIDPNHLENFLNIEEEAKKGQGILGTKNIFLEKPAIIVGAGPSLDKDLDLLKEYQNNFVVISCDAAFPILEANNIKPDVIFMADWTAKQKYNFRKDGKKNGEHIDLTGYNVVIPSIVHKEVLEEINKSPNCHVFWYNIWDPGSKLMQCIPNKIGKKGGLVAGVLTTGMAFEFALGMGCFPNIFVGHDLSYSIKNDEIQGYSQHISKDKADYQKKTKMKSDLMMFPDINGNMVLTHLTFTAFYNWLNGFINSRNVKIINASECGILHGENVIQMNFQNVCEKYGVNNLIEEKKEKLKGAWYYNTSEEIMFL